MNIYGYCRISTRKQNIERQERNIKAAYPNAIIVKETFTGTKIVGRKALDKVLKKVKTGDTIVFDSVSRMSRNAEEGVALYKELFAKGVNLVFLKEHHVDTETYRAAMNGAVQLRVQTGDDATDDLVNGIGAAVNAYMLRLAERQIVLAFEQSQKEVDDLRERTKEGIQTARLDGKQIGVTEGTKLVTKKSIATKKRIVELAKDFGGTLSDVDVMKIVGVARNTYYKYKREIVAESTAV